MKILLIGGNGFVGKAITDELNKKDVDVYCLSRTKPSNNIKWIKGDIFNIDFSTIDDNISIAVHLIGNIKNKNLYDKLNYESLAESIQLCKEKNIKKLVFLSANGGFNDYLTSKMKAENLLKRSELDYLIVRPGLMYGTKRLSSYINVIPIKIFSFLGIPFFKNVYPLSVKQVAKTIVETILTNPQKSLLTLEVIRKN